MTWAGNKQEVGACTQANNALEILFACNRAPAGRAQVVLDSNEMIYINSLATAGL